MPCLNLLLLARVPLDQNLPVTSPVWGSDAGSFWVQEAMGKKRKSVACRLDEVDRTMHSTFCSAANSLSHLYTQAMNQQKVSFQTGERNALEKLYQWILGQHEQGYRVSSDDILSYLEKEIDYGEHTTRSPRIHLQQHNSQVSSHTANSVTNLFGAVVQERSGSGHQHGQTTQTKNNVFSNALSSPVRWNLQTFQLSQGSICCPDSSLPIENGPQVSDMSLVNPNSDADTLVSTDTTMDIRYIS